LKRDGAAGKSHTLRALDSLTVGVALSEGFKTLTRVKRPDSSEHDSFPSGHATAAFSVAAMESAFHPSEAPLWYAGAAAISDSRIVLHRHRWADVIAGAALGFRTSRLELSRRKGILIEPWMNGNGSIGLIVASKF
jgi:membrane-associated phospholipid phosphatase